MRQTRLVTTQPLRLDDLGAVQFAQLCREALATEAPLETSSRAWGFVAFARAGAGNPFGGRIEGPALLLAAWLRDGDSDHAALRLQQILAHEASHSEAPLRSVLVLTNVTRTPGLDGVRLTVAGPAEMWSLVRDRPRLRSRLPFLLGVSEPSHLYPDEPRTRSTADLDAAVALARVFVPTRSYARALDVLEQHRFVVLSGPPEMGKTAIARILGLAALSEGWELHECVRPEELWERFAEERAQVFIADDAFGSTEYQPETAERWALELDRALQLLDDRHRLIWTSRPAPLHAALRRIHREHGVERFPQPAHVGVDAADLDIVEKALILFRHAKALSAPESQLEVVRTHGWEIVSHPHFTPERIRRFCTNRLARLAEHGHAAADISAEVAAEIREPTEAMTASYAALDADHKAVLHALVDSPPGAVSEGELAGAVRRHAPRGLAHPVNQVVDRLADHFLRQVGTDGVTWVHPSWRDLVIDEITNDEPSRQAFLRGCGAHGAALALSTAGGGGTRELPFLQEDADWDALADRLGVLVPELEPPEVTLLLEAVAEATRQAPPGARREVDALAHQLLERVGRLWETGTATVPVGMVGAWRSLAAELPEPPPLPERAVAATWIELLPAGDVDLAATGETAALDDWLALTELLAADAPDLLARLGFPARPADTLRAIVASARTPPELDGPARTLLVRVLQRIGRLQPQLADDAHLAAAGLVARRSAVREEPEQQVRPLSEELERLLDQPLASDRHERELVARVLLDL